MSNPAPKIGQRIRWNGYWARVTAIKGDLVDLDVEPYRGPLQPMPDIPWRHCDVPDDAKDG